MKHIPEDFTVDSLKELNILIDEQNFTFAKAIVEGVLKNLNTDIPEVSLMSIIVKSEKAAYAIAVSQLQKSKNLKKNSIKPTAKGIKQGNKTPSERAKLRQAKYSNRKTSDFKYNKKTNRATLKA